MRRAGRPARKVALLNGPFFIRVKAKPALNADWPGAMRAAEKRRGEKFEAKGRSRWRREPSRVDE